MKLARTKRASLIRKYLLNSIKTGNPNVFQEVMDTFSVSRQTIHGHLSSLVKMGYLIAEGNTRARTYKMGPLRLQTGEFSLSGLREGDVYTRNFEFIFNDLPTELESICHYGFTEMLNNAIDHSEGVLVDIEVKRSAKQIEIRMSDDGEGIFNHIARIMELGDPRESILELSKGKLTTDPDNHSGQGIFFTSRVFDEFYIFSGSLIFSHHVGEKDYLLHNEIESSGTSVFMMITLDSHRTLKSVFDDYTGSEDENYAFNTTVVPVRLAIYEGERLVSRSQAKRILNRVEKFKDVLLDFKGIDFIGQGFADEVFRVFANRNPQISLIPVNVAEQVNKMITAAKNHDS